MILQFELVVIRCDSQPSLWNLRPGQEIFSLAIVSHRLEACRMDIYHHSPLLSVVLHLWQGGQVGGYQQDKACVCLKLFYYSSWTWQQLTNACENVTQRKYEIKGKCLSLTNYTKRIISISNF
jgi:hypothetical protein